MDKKTNILEIILFNIEVKCLHIRRRICNHSTDAENF